MHTSHIIIFDFNSLAAIYYYLWVVIVMWNTQYYVRYIIITITTFTTIDLVNELNVEVDIQQM